MSKPLVSVVVPTFNRLARLQRVISALEQQDIPRNQFEVVVVSDGSSDGTHEYLAGLPANGAVHVVIQTNQGPAAARNKGIAEASGQLVLFVDDDVVAAPNLIAEHLRAHERVGRDAAVIGPLLTPPDIHLSPWVDWEQQMLVKQYDAMSLGLWKPTARQFYTGNASIRRELLLAVGGFNPSFRRAEDVELAYRLAARGVEFVFTMSAVGLHYADRSYQSWLEAAKAYGRNDAIFGRDGGQQWLLTTVRSEFGSRKWPVRLVVSACLDKPRLAVAFRGAVRGVARSASAMKLKKAEAASYSALFNLEYYRGFVGEMGRADCLLG